MSEYRAIFEVRDFRHDPDLPKHMTEKPRRFIKYADFDDWAEHEHLTNRIIQENEDFSDGGDVSCFLLCIINKSNNEIMQQAGGIIFKED